MSITAQATHSTVQPFDTAPDGGFGVYVHWPFCQAKCPYCDFNSHVRPNGHDQQLFLRGYLAELAHMRALTGSRTVTSVFFGGGTPSLMPPETVHAIIEEIGRLWSIKPEAEITLEANPTSVEAERFAGFRHAGVNRVSLGVQSLNDTELKALGRLHSAAEARGAIEIAAEHFSRVSFDLIYARPAHRSDDAVARWRDELKTALGLGCNHLSLYQLTIEPGTPFKALHDAGKLNIPEGDQAHALFEATQEVCAAAGLPAYEISNHAKPGEECQHNLLYWRYQDYACVGPGAHGRVSTRNDRRAISLERHPETWAQQVSSAGHAIVDEQVLSKTEQADEMLLMSMRLKEGVNIPALEKLTGLTVAKSTLNALEDDGMITPSADGTHVRATDKSRFVLNNLVLDLSTALEPVR